MKSTGQRKWQQGEYNHLARKKKKAKLKCSFILKQTTVKNKQTKKTQNHTDIKLDNYIVFWAYNAHTVEYLVVVLSNVL